MKGLSNYVCLRRLARARPAALAGRRSRAGSAAGVRGVVTDGRPRRAARSGRRRAAVGRGRGDARDAHRPALHVLRALLRDAACAARAAAAPLIIVNHHLFFADLALRARWPEAQVLPPYEVVIFDEAHQIEDVATEFFGVHASTQRLFALARDLGRETGVDAQRAQAAPGASRPPPTRSPTRCASWCRAPRPGVEETRVAVPGDLAAEPALAALPRPRRAPRGDRRLAAPRRRRGGQLATPDRARRRSARRARALRTDLSLLVDGRGREHVRWLAASRPQRRPARVARRRQPGLGRALDACPGPIVLTSATLTVAGIVRLPARARRPRRHARPRRRFPSPFDYARQALLYLRARSARAEPRRLPAAAAARMAELCAITGGRALLLFTSFRNMRIAEAHLRAALPFPLLVQGERPRHLLLAAMRARVGSVLLATQSFWEGVDVPGEALSLVVMDRIPFAVPDDPLTAARIDRIRDDGRRSVRRLPAAARGAGAQAGLRPPDPHAHRPRHRRRARRARRAQELRRDAARQPAARLPAHRAARRRRRVLGAACTSRRSRRGRRHAATS